VLVLEGLSCSLHHGVLAPKGIMRQWKLWVVTHLQSIDWIAVLHTLPTIFLALTTMWLLGLAIRRGKRPSTVRMRAFATISNSTFYCPKCREVSYQGSSSPSGPQRPSKVCTFVWWNPWGCALRVPEHFHVRCASCKARWLMETADASARRRVEATAATGSAVAPEVPEPVSSQADLGPNEVRVPTKAPKPEKKVESATLWQRLREKDE
jgi:hypothetical protein